MYSPLLRCSAVVEYSGESSGIGANICTIEVEWSPAYGIICKLFIKRKKKYSSKQSHFNFLLQPPHCIPIIWMTNDVFSNSLDYSEKN